MLRWQVFKYYYALHWYFCTWESTWVLQPILGDSPCPDSDLRGMFRWEVVTLKPYIILLYNVACT